MNSVKYLLDSSAMLAVIYGEPGENFVAGILNQAALSTVNLAECADSMARRGLPAADLSKVLTEMVVALIDFDRHIALAAGGMAKETRPLGLSLGDRACIATAIHYQLEVVTADKIWAKLKHGPKIRFIR